MVSKIEYFKTKLRNRIRIATKANTDIFVDAAASI
tara:strand:- start:4302 stop:4406 length:105 start_codon:yes stop_codon:yes gene_type:complete